VEALTRQDAEAAAIKNFNLDDEQRTRLVEHPKTQGKSPGSSPLARAPRSGARSAAADRDSPIATILLRHISAVEP
jgi:hypothetical protein